MFTIRVYSHERRHEGYVQYYTVILTKTKKYMESHCQLIAIKFMLMKHKASRMCTKHRLQSRVVCKRCSRQFYGLRKKILTLDHEVVLLVKSLIFIFIN